MWTSSLDLHDLHNLLLIEISLQHKIICLEPRVGNMLYAVVIENHRSALTGCGSDVALGPGRRQISATIQIFDPDFVIFDPQIFLIFDPSDFCQVDPGNPSSEI